MPTATILVRTYKGDSSNEDRFTYYKMHLPRSFYDDKTPEDLQRIRKSIEKTYIEITGLPYVVAKFDKVQRYFDQ